MFKILAECGENDSRLSRRIKNLRDENIGLRYQVSKYEKTIQHLEKNYNAVLAKGRIDQDALFQELLSLSKHNAELQTHKNHLTEQVASAKAQLKEAQQNNNLLQQDNEQLRERLAVTRATVINLQKQIFGPKTETTAHHNNVIAAQLDLPVVKRKRGKQPKTPGFGRTIRTNLPAQKVFHELPLFDRCCKQCGKEYRLLPWTKDSQEIDMLVKVIRLMHKRRRYRKACDCSNQPAALIAPVPPKLIPKGLFSTRFVSEVLIEKYLLQRPVNRILKSLNMHGLNVSSGTIIGSLRYIDREKVFDNLNESVKDRNRCALHWHLDETSWKVFEEIERKESYRWWLWVSASKDTTVYLLDPGRGKSVPETYFAEVSQGIASCDRLKAYLCLKSKFKLAYCWSHARRDFIEVRNGFPEIAPQAHDWVERINDLFEQNKKRCQYEPGSKEFIKEEKKLRAMLKEMERVMLLKLTDPTLHPELAAALTRLKNHWAGHIVFLEHSEIPMDNNEAERKLRNPVVGRKNYYGSGSQWSGEFAAKMFTILETIDMNGLDVRKWLNEYLDACAKNGGKAPDNTDEWLPWNMTAERKAELAKSKPLKSRF
jgi:transposase